ncbi:MAG: hypothetical protein XU15_C0011G0156 [candidate division NC10 bacterium CSP1-5]|nr:MAG: hypothetical protein XU15_C0011G0012 [candidate division NC10 bacterium CSP1-5]KRT69474.1 MAG: hypothetical protein XU15_C0011G0156 [candidate division NC10 bacterium CSP1-5]
MFNKEKAGRIARGRRIVKDLDDLILIVETDTAFGPDEFREVQPLMDNLVKARMCASNILLRLGDQTAFQTSPTIRTFVVPGYDPNTGATCPDCGKRMFLVRSTASEDGSRIFSCTACNKEHIL